MKRKHLLIAFVGIGLIVAAVWWQRRGSDSDQSRDTTSGVNRSGTGDSARVGRPGGLEGTLRAALRKRIPSGATPSDDKSFTGTGKYPAGSIPLDPSNRAHVFPNAGSERRLPVGPRRSPPAAAVASDDPSGQTPAGASDPERAERLNYVLKADKYAVVGKDVVNITLEVHRERTGGPRKPVPAQIVTSYLATPPGPGDPGRKAAAMAFNDDGVEGDLVAGDLVYTSRVAPARLPIAGTAGAYYPVVEFLTEDQALTKGRISFSYTPADQIPGRFTGEFKDAQIDGSLVITVGVDITEPGDFVIDGTLLDREGKPLGRANYIGHVEIGKSTIELTFYGLMFRERQADGPYTLRYVRGHRVRKGETPNRSDMPIFVGDYETADYSASSFTDAGAGAGDYPGG